MSVDQDLQRPATSTQDRALHTRLSNWTERSASSIFVMPSVLIILCLSIFPLIVSLYLSLSRVKLTRGDVQVNFVGLKNYEKLLFGSQQRRLLGQFETPSLLGWFVFGLVTAVILFLLYRYLHSLDFSPLGLFWRGLVGAAGAATVLLLSYTLNAEGLPGTFVVTLIFVFAGIFLQYLLGLGLALLTTQNLPGRRYFRIIFLLPMMITPVGIGYMFRMLTDTSKGPFNPIWFAMGLGDFSWVDSPWGARLAVIIGDTWQWTPFIFIVLVAALEGQSIDQIEAAVVDGANKWQIFRHITLPQILPVSTTVVLIRTIEAFKIIDMPQILTSGGPGTATEPLTLHAFLVWRSSITAWGESAAVAYILLFTVTFVALSYVHLIRRRFTGVV